MNEYADLVNLSYTYGDTPSFKANRGNHEQQKLEHLERFSLDHPNYQIDKSLSDTNSVVGLKNNGDVVMAIRGTHFKKGILRPGDAIADTKIFLGRSHNPILGKKIQNDLDKFNLIKTKYPNANHIITGHSLGASSGWRVAKKYKKEAHLFSMFDVGTGSEYNYIPDKPMTFYAGKWNGIPDMLSVMSMRGYNGKKVYLDTDTWDSHSLSNFTTKDGNKHSRSLFNRKPKFYIAPPTNLQRGGTYMKRFCYRDKGTNKIECNYTY